ncbi:OmpH family outer membrane protein [Prevotella sp. E9-3]|uniref:OmpH family outer membrane protein n=1 Tax=Prevotella sp. E9-3 TaxID=2913621 RepID=UPI001EDAAE78|nr:OmpH family outer membrane protein [Prevotella sp. E9-3]UKK49599.1 OmpH family outer membrane protein [Prevotella sp. E9-3]
MKKSFIYVLSIAFALVSCNKQAEKMDSEPVVSESTENQGGIKIAYIEVDSLMTQFEFAKERSKELEKKSLNARNTLNQKGNQLQAAANNFQQKLQNNSFTSREQAEGVQAALQRQQSDLATLQARLENELASEQQKFLQALQDSLDNFLAIYNKDKKYDMIINKSAILYSDKKYDITQEVINGLNKRYKKQANKENK